MALTSGARDRGSDIWRTRSCFYRFVGLCSLVCVGCGPWLACVLLQWRSLGWGLRLKWNVALNRLASQVSDTCWGLLLAVETWLSFRPVSRSWNVVLSLVSDIGMWSLGLCLAVETWPWLRLASYSWTRPWLGRISWTVHSPSLCLHLNKAQL